MISVSYGGGVNSTALLVGLHARGVRPDYILFADTGGELPSTYQHVAVVSAWSQSLGWPAITRVTNAGAGNHGHASLEDECLRNVTLPSIAYGNKGCSTKWKRQPQERYLAAQPDVQALWQAGGKVNVCLGIDAGESHRGAAMLAATHKRWIYYHPLIEWGWAREECIAAIARAGLPVPGKSACFFCPSSKKHEVLSLARHYPDLFARAVDMERNAAPANTHITGLGRRYSWEKLVAADAQQAKLFPDTIELPCGCFDGDAEEAQT